MSVKEAVLAALNELVLPELQVLKQEQGEIKARQRRHPAAPATIRSASHAPFLVRKTHPDIFS